jgi:hypothetical protein
VDASQPTGDRHSRNPRHGRTCNGRSRRRSGLSTATPTLSSRVRMLGWPRWRPASAHSAESYACLPIAHGDGEIACPRSRSDALIERSPQRRQHVAPRLHRLRRVQGAKTDRLYAEVLDAIARGDSVTSRPARRIDADRRNQLLPALTPCPHWDSNPDWADSKSAQGCLPVFASVRGFGALQMMFHCPAP